MTTRPDSRDADPLTLDATGGDAPSRSDDAVFGVMVFFATHATVGMTMNVYAGVTRASDVVIRTAGDLTTCVHGVDLHFVSRCYLCRPDASRAALVDLRAAAPPCDHRGIGQPGCPSCDPSASR